MRTPHSQTNQDFSDKAHYLARQLIYPQFFGVKPDQITYDDVTGVEDERNAILDGQMAVDKIVNVTVGGFGHHFTYTVQERFRRIKFENYRDVTVTTWNNNSNLPSELFKIRSWYFLYGYYDDRRNRFGEVVMVNTPELVRGIQTQKLFYQFGLNRRSNQDFVCVRLNALRQARLVLWSNRPGDGWELP